MEDNREDRGNSIRDTSSFRGSEYTGHEQVINNERTNDLLDRILREQIKNNTIEKNNQEIVKNLTEVSKQGVKSLSNFKQGNPNEYKNNKDNEKLSTSNYASMIDTLMNNLAKATHGKMTSGNYRDIQQGKLVSNIFERANETLANTNHCVNKLVTELEDYSKSANKRIDEYTEKGTQLSDAIKNIETYNKNKNDVKFLNEFIKSDKTKNIDNELAQKQTEKTQYENELKRIRNTKRSKRSEEETQSLLDLPKRINELNETINNLEQSSKESLENDKKAYESSYDETALKEALRIYNDLLANEQDRLKSKQDSTNELINNALEKAYREISKGEESVKQINDNDDIVKRAFDEYLLNTPKFFSNAYEFNEKRLAKDTQKQHALEIIDSQLKAIEIAKNAEDKRYNEANDNKDKYKKAVEDANKEFEQALTDFTNKETKYKEDKSISDQKLDESKQANEELDIAEDKLKVEQDIADEAKKTYEEQIEELNQVQEKIIELRDKLKDGKLTDEERADYKAEYINAINQKNLLKGRSYRTKETINSSETAIKKAQSKVDEAKQKAIEKSSAYKEAKGNTDKSKEAMETAKNIKEQKEINKEQSEILHEQNENIINNHDATMKDLQNREDSLKRTESAIKKTLTGVGELVNKFFGGLVDGFINTIDSYMNTFIGEWSSGFQTVYSALEKTENDVNKKLDINSAEYRDIIERADSFIKDNDLSKQITLADMTNELSAMVDYGIRDFSEGSLGEALMQGSILAKATGSSYNFTNDKTMQSMKKMYQDEINKGGTTEEASDKVLKYMQAMVGAEKKVIDTLGTNTTITNGTVNTIMTSMADIFNANNLSSDAQAEIAADIALKAEAYNNAGADITPIIEQIKTIYNAKDLSEIPDELKAIMQEAGLTKDEVQEYVATNRSDELIDLLTKGFVDLYNQGKASITDMGYLQKAFGNNMSTDQAQALRNAYSSETVKLIEKVDTSFESSVARFDESFESLKAGDFSSQDSEITKGMTNSWNGLAIDMQQSVPFGDKLFATGFNNIQNLLSSILKQMGMMMVTGNISGVAGSMTGGILGTTAGKLGAVGLGIGEIVTAVASVGASIDCLAEGGNFEEVIMAGFKATPWNAYLAEMGESIGEALAKDEVSEDEEYRQEADKNLQDAADRIGSSADKQLETLDAEQEWFKSATLEEKRKKISELGLKDENGNLLNPDAMTEKEINTELNNYYANQRLEANRNRISSDFVDKYSSIFAEGNAGMNDIGDMDSFAETATKLKNGTLSGDEQNDIFNEFYKAADAMQLVKDDGTVDIDAFFNSEVFKDGDFEDFQIDQYKGVFGEYINNRLAYEQANAEFQENYKKAQKRAKELGKDINDVEEVLKVYISEGFAKDDNITDISQLGIEMSSDGKYTMDDNNLPQLIGRSGRRDGFSIKTAPAYSSMYVNDDYVAEFEDKQKEPKIAEDGTKIVENGLLDKEALTTPSGYATGLEYVPTDNYPAFLHHGEMVLNNQMATKFRNKNLIDTDYIDNAFNNISEQILDNSEDLNSLSVSTDNLSNLSNSLNESTNLSNNISELSDYLHTLSDTSISQNDILNTSASNLQNTLSSINEANSELLKIYNTTGTNILSSEDITNSLIDYMDSTSVRNVESISNKSDRRYISSIMDEMVNSVSSAYSMVTDNIINKQFQNTSDTDIYKEDLDSVTQDITNVKNSIDSQLTDISNNAVSNNNNSDILDIMNMSNSINNKEHSDKSDLITGAINSQSDRVETLLLTIIKLLSNMTGNNTINGRNSINGLVRMDSNIARLLAGV